MKVKTITCHNVYNTGASLQAYALVTYLRSLGHDVEIIDYVPDYLTHYRLAGVANPVYDKPIIKELYNLAKLPGRLIARCSKRKTAFDRFTAQYLPLTERHYGTFEALKSEPPEADIYIAGSDQIWNSFFKNGRDPSFYLQFAPKGCVRASYAASFAIPEIADEYREQTRKWLMEFDHLSVRENSGLRILESLGIEGGCTVADPVFLLSKEEWETLCPNAVVSDRYVLVYDFDGNPAIRRMAEMLAASRGLKIFTLQKLGYGDQYIADAGPIEFVQMIKGASYVLSNSFHATAFSLIFHRPFMVFDREEGINTRMHDLLDMAGVEYERKPEDAICWETVQQRMNEYITNSRDYLHNILNRSV